MSDIREQLASREPTFVEILDGILQELDSRLPEDATAQDIDRVLTLMEREQAQRHQRELAQVTPIWLTDEQVSQIARPYALFALSMPVVAIIVAIVIWVTR
jgi:uncharacterized membrane protein